ncbi:flagellar hook protein FlgL [Cypionkella aquatica]|uniref:Flagellar hook protein FlgL n=1 Tax=Cypionkella aquatica TaxID=1756042 RepID=A0AA37TSU4_9RHOB|nr:flagellin [Cypionkella aquatica]GLS85208.1 flagellar hook protein FlgL [Cypionkella aquatica]
MSAISLGDMARSFMLRRHTLDLKQTMQQLTNEVATGQVGDVAARVSGDLIPIASIDASLARLKGYTAVTTEAGLFVGAMQTALGTVDKLAGTLSNTLISTTTGASASLLDAAGRQAEQDLQTALSVFNTRFGDRSLFAGTATSNAPLVASDTLLSALVSAVSGAVSAQDVETAVTNWFADPNGYDALAYQGGDALAALAIAPGEQTHIDVTAKDPALRNTIKGLAMAALLNRGVLADQNTGRQDLARRAGLGLLENKSDRTNVAAKLGLVEAQIDAAATRNATENYALQIARNGITEADPYETASRLEETQAQLEKIYAITARMSRLSLLDYL